MDFRAAAENLALQRQAVDRYSDPAASPGRTPDADLSSDIDPRDVDAAPSVESDGRNPASPGGPAPYNGAEPFGEPVTSDPEWLDPQGPKPRRYQPMPYVPGPDEDVTTLHPASRRPSNARGHAHD